MSQHALLVLSACVASFGVASAQSLNVDVGVTFPVPASTFGAAAAQPGVWNAVNADQAGATALVDLSGAATSVTIQRVSGTGSEMAVNNVGTLGNDEALMDDGDDPGLGSTWRVSGLAAGDYEVTVYAWAPDVPDYQTVVYVNGGGPTIVGGPWTGGYVAGITHAVRTVTLAPGANLDLLLSPLSTFDDLATFNGVQVRQLTPPYSISCPGDGSVVPCPCGNSGSAGHGCANSSFAAGARLSGSGTFSVTSDTAVLNAVNLTGTGAYFYQGDALTPPFVIDDGLGCVSGTLIRIAGRAIIVNTSLYPWAGDLPLSVRGALPPAGGTRHYQCFYRNAAPQFCPPGASNRTNGVSVTWVP